MVGSFNGRLRQACLNEQRFSSLADARSKTKASRTLYNEERPNRVQALKTPVGFAREHGSSSEFPVAKSGRISTG